MITIFEYFLNEGESSEDIKRRLLQRIDNAFKQIRSKYDIPEPVSISETKPINPVTTEKEPVPSITETKPTEKEPVGPIKNKIKQVKFKKTTEADKFKDERMNAAYNGLTSLGFTEDNVLKYLNRIDLEADDTTENIIQTGIKHLSKNK